MVLTVLYRAIEDLLDRLCDFIISVFLPRPTIKKSKGMSELDVTALKYEYMGVSLPVQAEYKIIRELRHVRNCCVHNRNVCNRAYLSEFPSPRWPDYSERISIDEKQWVALFPSGGSQRHASRGMFLILFKPV